LSWADPGLHIFLGGWNVWRVTTPKYVEFSEAAAEKYIGRKTRGEAAFRMVEGSFLSFCGIVVVFLIASVALFGFFVIGIRSFVVTGELSTFRSKEFILVWYLAVLGISILVARHSNWHSDYSEGRLTPPFFPRTVRGLAFAGDFLAGGPRLLSAGGESFAKAFRLLSLDVSQVGPIIFWLWQRGAKATTDQIADQFPGLNTVRILPQLRDIPGVIWLPDPRGILLLSTEFRAELAKAIGRPRPVPPPPEPEPAYEKERQREPRPEPGPGQSNEILEWYKTLGLPAYASIPQVKRRYRQLAKIHHPDALAGGRTRARDRTDETMKRINIAYQNILRHSASH
jgi:hypothetical protein